MKSILPALLGACALVACSGTSSGGAATATDFSPVKVTGSDSPIVKLFADACYAGMSDPTKAIEIFEAAGWDTPAMDKIAATSPAGHYEATLSDTDLNGGSMVMATLGSLVFPHRKGQLCNIVMRPSRSSGFDIRSDLATLAFKGFDGGTDSVEYLGDVGRWSRKENADQTPLMIQIIIDPSGFTSMSMSWSHDVDPGH